MKFPNFNKIAVNLSWQWSARFFHRYLFQGVMSSFWKGMRSCTEPFSEWVDPNDHFQAIIVRCVCLAFLRNAKYDDQNMQIQCKISYLPSFSFKIVFLPSMNGDDYSRLQHLGTHGLG